MSEAIDEKTKNRIIAEYQKVGTGVTELSKKYGISANTINSWIKRKGIKRGTKKPKPPAQKKAPKKDAPKAPKSKDAQKKKRGAPYGNLNALGAGAPLGNSNAVTHGCYKTIMWDTLTEEEKSLAENLDTDPEILLIEQIRILTIRERRFLKRIQEYEHAEKYKSGIALESVIRTEHKRSFNSDEEKAVYDDKISEKIAAGERLPGNDYALQTVSEATYNIIQRLEEGLTRCQNQKYRAIQELNHIQALKGNGGKNAVAVAWVKTLMGVNNG